MLIQGLHSNENMHMFLSMVLITHFSESLLTFSLEMKTLYVAYFI